MTLLGVLGWVLNKPQAKAPQEQEFWDDHAQIVGWISAILYRRSSILALYSAAENLGVQSLQGSLRSSKTEVQNAKVC